MKLTKKSFYAIRAMLALAEGYPETKLTIGVIAQRHNIPQKFLEQILLQLKESGLVVSRAGPAGGYRLARDPSEITVAQIFQAAEGKLAPLGAIEELSQVERTSAPLVRLHYVFQEIRSFTVAKFESLSLADLSATQRPPSPGSFRDYEI